MCASLGLEMVCEDSVRVCASLGLEMVCEDSVRVCITGA